MLELPHIKLLKSYWCQFAAVITASFGSVSNGMEFSWTSPAVPRLMSNESHFNITHDESFWLETLYILGGVCSLPFTFVVLQFLGRRKSILISGSISLTCWILVATSESIPQLYAARFISGIGSNIAFVGIPMYSAEISEPNVRGFFGTFTYTMSIIGSLLSYAIVPYIPIYASAIVGAFVSFLQVSLFYWQPESPYFLLTKHRNVQAKEMLTRLRCADRNIVEELEQITKAVERQNTEKSRLIDLILIPSNRKSFIIMSVLNTSQNVSGITVITMNVQSILEKGGAAKGSELSAIIFGIILLVSSIFGSILIDKLGRKIFLTTSCLLTSLFLGILGGYFYVQDIQKVDTSDYHWIPFFAVLSYAFVFKCGIGLVPIVLSGELFPTSIKSMGMTLSDFWFTLWATLSIKIFYSAVELYGMYFPFLCFSLCAFLTSIFVCFYVPETKGKTLEEIQMILKGLS